MLGIGDEISIFLQALLAGNIVLLVYTCIRVFRIKAAKAAKAN